MKQNFILKTISIGVFLFLFIKPISAQDEEIAKQTIDYKNNIQRKTNETILQLAKRIKPINAAFQHKILELALTNPKLGKDILLCYADTSMTEEVPYVILQLLSPFKFENKLNYKTVFVSAIDHGTEGMAKINAVFLANADNDTSKELIVIYTTNMRKYDSKTDSWYLQDYSDIGIYDSTGDACYYGECLDELELVENKFKSSNIPYTAKSVKAKLKALGFKN